MGQQHQHLNTVKWHAAPGNDECALRIVGSAVGGVQYTQGSPAMSRMAAKKYRKTMQIRIFWRNPPPLTCLIPP